MCRPAVSAPRQAATTVAVGKRFSGGASGTTPLVPVSRQSSSPPLNAADAHTGGGRKRNRVGCAAAADAPCSRRYGNARAKRNVCNARARVIYREFNDPTPPPPPPPVRTRARFSYRQHSKRRKTENTIVAAHGLRTRPARRDGPPSVLLSRKTYYYYYYCCCCCCCCNVTFFSFGIKFGPTSSEL